MKQTSNLKTLVLVSVLVATSISGKAQWEYKMPLHKARAFAATEVIGRKIYVIGGATSRTESTAGMEVYDFDNDRWDTTRASLPKPICAAGSAVLNGKIYVIGGKTTYEDNTWLNTVYEYNPDSNKWTLLPYTMHIGRAFLSACTLGKEIYAIGGRTPTLFSITNVEKFDPLTPTGWVTVGGLLYGRSNFTAEVLNGKIYVMGGVDQANPTTVERYDPETGAGWVVTGQNINRYLHGSTSYGGNIYLVGGIGNSSDILFDATQYYPDNGFSTLPCMLQDGVGACGAAIIEDSLAAIGGHLFVIGGALYPFFVPTTPGPPVSASVLMYCESLVSAKDDMAETAPISLLQNQPNPFSAQTTINYDMKTPGDIRIQVFDLNGQAVATLWEGRQESGRHSVSWDAAGVPEGVYLYRLRSDELTVTRKCIRIHH